MTDAPQGDSKADAEVKSTPDEESTTEKVNSEEGTEDKKTTDDDTSKSEADTKSTPDEEEKESDEEGKYFFHNKTLDTIEEVIDEAQGVLGRNAQLAGELDDAQEELDTKNIQLQEALEANKKWQEFYEGKGEKPVSDIDSIKKAIREVEAEKEQIKKRQEFEVEFEKVTQKPDYDTVFPEMKNIAKEKGKDFVAKLSPTELYNMAKMRLGLLSKVDTEKMKKEIEKKVTLQKSVSSQTGGNARKSAGTTGETSPEVADYFQQILP